MFKGKKRIPERAGRSAEQPGQAVNVDLCFVPVEHGEKDKLPAVSGSSGHLVVERLAEEREAAHWPGQVFGQVELDYEEAMQSYAQQTRDRLTRQKGEFKLPENAPTVWRQSWQAREERHRVLQQRRKEDEAWLIERQAHHQLVEAYRALTRRNRAAQAIQWEAHKAYWAKQEQQRLAVLAQRKEVNDTWHQHNREREHGDQRSWIAVLVLTDNCSRQCIGLPVFASGAKITAQEVVTALRILLPQELAFLISDQGTHFRSKLLAQLAQEADFVQIPIYRHRPQSNGIAERFVRTLKQWLRDQFWTGADELTQLLIDFRLDYNNRPHQGLPSSGLSPNEFASRIWLM
jgi:transposase InsO family protein